MAKKFSPDHVTDILASIDIASHPHLEPRARRFLAAHRIHTANDLAHFANGFAMRALSGSGGDEGAETADTTGVGMLAGGGDGAPWNLRERKGKGKRGGKRGRPGRPRGRKAKARAGVGNGEAGG